MGARLGQVGAPGEVDGLAGDIARLRPAEVADHGGNLFHPALAPDQGQHLRVILADLGGGAADGVAKAARRKAKPDKTDLARQWGFLPQHDRMEVSQGFDEEFLPRFHEQILRYYRDLAREAGEESR